VQIPIYDDGASGSVVAPKKKRKSRDGPAIVQEAEHTVPWIAALTTYFRFGARSSAMYQQGSGPPRLCARKTDSQTGSWWRATNSTNRIAPAVP